MNGSTYKVIGLMSGTSLDGLDMAYCVIRKANIRWGYSIEKTKTVPYPEDLRKLLSNATSINAIDLTNLDHLLGKWMGKEIHQFIAGHQLNVDFIANHGHTIFHQPQEGFTLQIGNANDIHQATSLPVVYDFRSLDVAHGGQGAPLVPIGDMLLFGGYNACINLGGIANISFQKNDERIAYDICPANMMLNELASKDGQEYDNEGTMARTGKVNSKLLGSLNELAFYELSYPKSLGYEWFSEQVLPLILSEDIMLEDRMNTCVEHVAIQIAKNTRPGEVLITGGGVYNTYLLERIKSHCHPNVELVVPESELVNYKEALIFGLLGILRIENKINVLCSVTGATKDTCGGSILGNITTFY